MLTLSQDILDKINATNRQPIQLIEFHFGNEIIYLSDQSFESNENFTNNYLPYIEDWGILQDNVNIEPVLNQSAIESRQMSVTIINNQSPSFTSNFKDNPPENVEVYLYQLFDGIQESEKILIDIFVCQDPIIISEANLTVKIDLVSVIMRKNPFICGLESIRDQKFPYVVGKAERLKAIRIDENPVTSLENDLTYDAIDFIIVENSIGFNASGYLIIDSEVIGYTTWQPGAFATLTRGQYGTTARPHVRGAKVMHYARNYDYAFATGPVNAITNIKLDDSTYGNQIEIHNESNPAFVRFLGRLPYFNIEAGNIGPPIVFPDTDTNQFGSSYEQNNISGVVWNIDSPANINESSNIVTMSTYEEKTSNKTKSFYGTGYATYRSPNSNAAEANSLSNINQSAGVGGYAARSSTTSDSMLYAALMSTHNIDFSSYGTFVSASATVKFRGYGNDYATRYAGVCYRTKGSSSAPTGLTTHIWGATNDGNFFTAWYEDTVNLSFINSWETLKNFEIGARTYSLQHSPYWVNLEIQYVLWKVIYIEPYSATLQEIELVSHFNRDLSTLGTFKSAKAKIAFTGSAVRCKSNFKTIKRTNNDSSSNSTVNTTTIDNTNLGLTYIEDNLSANTWAEMATMRYGMRLEMEGETNLLAGQYRQSACWIYWILWIITYQPFDAPTPNEERVVYGEIINADVTGVSGFPLTPPMAIKSMLERVGNLNSFIDTISFNEANTYYNNLQYYFNGVLSANLHFHDALKELLRQGCCRLCFNQGKIKIKFYKATTDNPVKNFTNSERLIKSIKEERKSIEDVKNSILIKCNYDLTDEYFNESEIYTNQDSVLKFGLLEGETTFDLINDTGTIEYIWEILKLVKSKPFAITTFTFFFSAFPIEKMDIITVETTFNDYFFYAGEVITVSRNFGNGKKNEINTFTITCKRVANVAYVQELFENVYVTDNEIHKANYTAHIENIIDQINIDDIENVQHGLQKTVTVNETININDQTIEESARNYGYGSNGYGQYFYGGKS